MNTFFKRGLTLVLGMGVMLSVGGCTQVDQLVHSVEEEAYTPTRTTLQIHSDGSMTETILEELDREYYDAAELERMVRDTVDAYNQEAGAEAVSVTECSFEENGITLIMDYQSWKDYGAYNQVACFAGSMLNAQLEGYLFYNEFYPVEDGVISGDKISNEVPLSHKEYQVAVSDLSHDLRVPGKIVYLSANAKLLDGYTAAPDDTAKGADAGGLVLPSSEIYLPEGSGEITATDLEHSYMYLIYEY